MVKLPVDDEQEGCVIVPIVGWSGAPGGGAIIAAQAEEAQLEPFLAVTLYVPAARPVKIVLVW